MGTFKEPLNPWINPIIDAATSADDFLLTDVRKKKMTVYIGILPNKLAESRIIVNLFFSQLINQNTKELPQDNPDLKHQCLLLMDEFTSIGRVEIIAHSVSYMAGYNIRLFPIIQSVAQLDAVYGKEYARTIITNHALQIIYTPREQQDANEYSEMLGYTTVKRKNVSRGRERSVSESEERRALMLLRSGAVIGAIFLSLVLYCWMAYDILTSIDTKAGIAWIFYYIWGLFCFISSIYPSIKKPRFFTKSAWSAFFAAIATNLFGTILIIFLCILGKQIL